MHRVQHIVINEKAFVYLPQAQQIWLNVVKTRYEKLKKYLRIFSIPDIEKCQLMNLDLKGIYDIFYK